MPAAPARASVLTPFRRRIPRPLRHLRLRPLHPKKVEGMPDYSIKVNVPLVNVDVLVTTKGGQFVPGLKKDNFRLFEDGSAQQITNFNVSQAPITAVLLVEFASTNYCFMVQALQASYAFANTLTKDDWVAVSLLRHAAAHSGRFHPGQESSLRSAEPVAHSRIRRDQLFDALYDTLDRLDRVEGKKYVILVTTGIDTLQQTHAR